MFLSFTARTLRTGRLLLRAGVVCITCLAMFPASAAHARAPVPATRPHITHGDAGNRAIAPVLLVHGLSDTTAVFDDMRRALWHAGVRDVAVFDMTPNDGTGTIQALAAQVNDAAAALRATTGADKVDVVAFSMGALVTRYWIQKLGGKAHVRRFVSISGPQHGTLDALLWFGQGIAEMRPGSETLQSLARDPDPWGTVRVHTLMTPLDVVIVPFSNSRLPGAKTEDLYWVPLHQWMVFDHRVQKRVAALLLTPTGTLDLRRESAQSTGPSSANAGSTHGQMPAEHRI